MVEMDPQLSLNQIRFIFADQLITQETIVKLGVKETCVLHGDPYHLLNRVFPENFGLMYDSLFPFLDTMLIGKERVLKHLLRLPNNFCYLIYTN